jgi:hypothetical protein
MHLNAHLDVDLIAVEQQDELALMLELTAPPAPGAAERGPATLEVVLDRSGSMGDGRLEAALTALDALVARLDPTDRFGLVVFDDEVDIVVPAGPLADKQAVREALRRVRTGATTNLSGGYLRGLQEARRVAGEGGATLLLLSDGHANAGVTDSAELESIAANARRHGVSTGTLGLGLGYDEVLMAGVARGGTGNHHFAEEGDTAGRLIAGEVDAAIRLTDERPERLNVDQTAAALELARDGAVPATLAQRVVPRLQQEAPGLRSALNARAGDRARSLLQTLSSRREDEQRHVAATLTELEATIRREAFGEDGAQESLFANIELEGDRRQVERDREALRARLDASPARSRRSSRPSSDATRTLVTGSSRRRSRCWSPKACGSESRQERLARRSLISSMRCSGSVGDSTNPNRP